MSGAPRINGSTPVTYPTVPTVPVVPSIIPGRHVEADDGPDEPRTRLHRYLADIERFIRKHVAFPTRHESVAVALWVAHAHVVEAFEVSPILAVTSAEPRSGKTRLLDCLELLVPHPFRAVTPSAAVVYTLLSRRPRPTMLLDEIDAIFGSVSGGRYDDLRAILNAGNRRGTPVLRVAFEGRSRKVEEFDLYTPKVVAGLGSLPDTVADRSILIRLKRRAPGEVIVPFRGRAAKAETEAIRFDWHRLPPLESSPHVPEELHDRAADGWEPLLAIADGAGGDWPDRARRAAVALSAQHDEQTTRGVRLLTDIRGVFRSDKHVPTPELLHRLGRLDGAPWSDWNGRVLTAAALAKLLEPYRIRPMQTRFGGGKTRGYFRSDFEDAWARYCPPPPEAGTAGTIGT